jgi:hypothetical protein
LSKSPYERELGNLYFQSSGRLVKLLGRESISNPNVALLELIKNSYDEDATEVKISFKNTKTLNGEITLEDNGNGMTHSDIEKKWMTLGTPNKTEDPYSKRYGRRKIGEKGIARFGADSLARHVLIETGVRNETFAYRLAIDWDQYLEPDVLFEKIPNRLTTVPKKPKQHGMKIVMTGLRERWSDERMLAFRKDVELLLPPTRKVEKFDVTVNAPEFPKYSGGVRTSFLNKAVYVFSSRLEIDGTVRFRLKTRYRQERKWTKKLQNLSCGPAEFHLFFYYRAKSEYDQPADFERVMDSLRLWSGVKLYRDKMKVKPYGDMGNDWIGLDKLRINMPSVYPGNNQIFGYVNVTKSDNPDLWDITHREGLAGNQGYNDLLRFLQDSVRAFAETRKEIEGKRKRQKGLRKVSRKPKPAKVSIVEDTLLDFSGLYPEVFYRRLEGEINDCYAAGLPNATLVLSRKLVENLIYNILETKYPRDRPLWWDINHNRPRDFSLLQDTLKIKKIEFVHDQRELLDKLLDLLEPFRTEANLKAHRIMNYLESKDELGRLKTPEIVQVALKLLDKVRLTR